MAKYQQFWEQLPNWEIPIQYQPSTFLSIVVPARNEANSIQNCIQSLLNQNYPKELFEIIIVDDHSEDDTASIVTSFQSEQIHLLNLEDYLNDQVSNTHKKDAIEYAVSKARGTLVVTTDADCQAFPDWLLLLASFHEYKQVEFIAAPVQFHLAHSNFEHFQVLDFMGMMLITGAGIESGWVQMCNGANLAYTKDLFERLDGFANTKHYASGDDMFFMQKVWKNNPKSIGFLKNPAASTFTIPKSTIKGFFDQRTRWAGKSGAYQQPLMTFILGLVFLFCVSLILNLFLALLFWDSTFWILFGIQLTIKSIADYTLLNRAARYFDRPEQLQFFWVSQPLHTLYVAVVGMSALFRQKHSWKGRRVK